MFYFITKLDIFNEPKESSMFSFNNRYSANIFHSIMPDTGAAGVSIVGEPQVQALQQLNSSIQINQLTAGQYTIHFGKGTAISLSTIRVQTPLKYITFYIIPTNTPFLFYIKDIDKLGVRLDNLKNILIQGDNRVPIIRK